MSKPEIAFVLTIIVLVLGISWYQLKDGERKTRDAQRKADVELVARKLMSYYEDHNYYPAASASGEIISCGLVAQYPCRWGLDPVIDFENVVYVQKLPNDPLANLGRKYMYVTLPNSQGFRIYTALERPQDKDIKKDLTIACGNALQCNWYVEN